MGMFYRALDNTPPEIVQSKHTLGIGNLHLDPTCDALGMHIGALQLRCNLVLNHYSVVTLVHR